MLEELPIPSSGLSALGVPGVPCLVDQLTLSQPRGADQIVLAPLDLKYFRRPCILVGIPGRLLGRVGSGQIRPGLVQSNA